jgi:hypothetical protein
MPGAPARTARLAAVSADRFVINVALCDICDNNSSPLMLVIEEDDLDAGLAAIVDVLR